MRVTLTYFVELREKPLLELFGRPGLLEQLRRSGAAISLAMLDLSDGRREVIQALNRHGIPVTAWLLLDEAHGYWLTADNAEEACRRYAQVLAWARAAGLKLEAVGLDIETPHEDSQALVRHGRQALGHLIRRRRSVPALAQAARRYTQLIHRIRADGLRVETYQLPLVLDERRARSTLLQRTLGFVDMAADREVVMLYRSLLPGPLGETLIDAYGAEAQAIGVGITGGGVEFLLELVGHRRLDLERLVVDLRRARRYTDHLYVFSLEGCVEAGFFDALCQADLSRPESAAPLGPLARAARGGLCLLLEAERLWDRVL